MVRILCRGGNLAPAEKVDWDEQTNISDYDIVFLNLRQLEKEYKEYVEYRESESSHVRVFDIADPKRVMDVLEHGGTVYAVLPQSSGTSLIPNREQPPDTLFQKARKEQAGIKPVATRVDFFSWFPAHLDVEDSGGKSVDEASIHPEWDWYFTDGFEWDICFNETKGSKDRGLRYVLQPLVENRYGKQLAGELVHTATRSRYEGRELGSIFLLPLLDGWGFETLAEKILEQFHPEVDVETPAGAPEWASEFSTPRQRELEEQVNELETQLDREKGFRTLLYGTGDELEAAVHRAFKGLGFRVEGEREGSRDGLVISDNRILVLEIEGTTGGISKEKLRQLYEWKENNEGDWDRPVIGLFVVNPKRRTRPDDRDITLPPDSAEYVQGKGLRVLRSPELFDAISRFQRGDLSSDAIEKALASTDVEISF